MPNWAKSMQQTFEFFKVDPNTWHDTARLNYVLSASVTRDKTSDTLAYATMEVTEPIGEEYIRIYLVTVQDNLRERFCLGTFLAQTSEINFDGKLQSISLDLYSPLLELADNQPPPGYTVVAGANAVGQAAEIIADYCRAPIVMSEVDYELSDNFMAEVGETWLEFVIALLKLANCELALDDMGRILIAPIRNLASMQAIRTYTDDNSSILYSDASDSRDLYGVPNVCEVIYSDKTQTIIGRAENSHPSSEISTVARGRTVLLRDTNPDYDGVPTIEILNAIAEQELRNASALEHTLTYSHGFDEGYIGEAVRLNYSRAGIDVRAVVTKQVLECSAGCKVEETAIYTESLWS